MSGPFLDEEDPDENPLADFGKAGGGIPSGSSNGARRYKRKITYPQPVIGEHNPMLGFAMESARQGMQNHANAAGAINSAIGQEMESRVAQQREMRRMAHEKELARMRLEAEAKRTEEMLRRMELMQRDDLPPGVISRIRIDGRGRVTHG